MSALDSLAEKNPLPVGATGIVASVMTSIVERMLWLSNTVVFLTQLVGLAVAVLTFLLLLRRWRRGRDKESDDLP